jgi:hypothetical protein
MHTGGEALTSAENYIGSNDFWNTLITAIVAIVVAVCAAWATLRSVNPRRRLIWRQHVNTTLLPDVNPATGISVTHGQNAVAEPRLVELLIKNAGRRDVQGSDFVNAENSLVFDFGAPIVSVLGSRVEPATAAPCVTSHRESELRIHPGLISRGQTIHLTVLVDGADREAVLKLASILETPVKEGGQGDFEPTSKRLLMLSQIAVLVAAMVAVVFAMYSAHKEIDAIAEAFRKDREMMKKAGQAVQEATDGLTLLRKCRYWDVHDPKRAKEECPEVEAPLEGRD